MCPEDYKRLIDFHGHSCPGLAIGYKAVKAAIEKGNLKKSDDEELVAIVETNSCSVDAIQFFLSCTFGKGNLIFKDYGKHVFTFGKRNAEKGLRISLRPGILKISQNLSNEEKLKRREKLVEKILGLPLEELFGVREVNIDLPEEAQIHVSVLCDRCGEPTMQTRTVKKGEKVYCIPCANELFKERRIQ